MKAELLEWVGENQRRTDNLEFPPVGAQVRIQYRIREGEKTRVQPFEGVVIRHHESPKSLHCTFTVRKISGGIGVERIFPYHSPLLEGVKVLRQGKVRRAKLYFLRQRSGKKARLRSK